jgi:hypothetical protein
MKIIVSSDASICVTKAELLDMASQLQDGETLVLELQLEDSWPLYEVVKSHIVVHETRERLELRKPIHVETFTQFIKED